MDTDATNLAQNQSTLNERLNSALTNAGTATNDGIANIALIQKARLAQQTRYANELNQEYGPDDSGTKAAIAKANATRVAMSRVTATSARATTPSPTVAATGWALQGHVYDASYAPIAGLTVFLVDGERAYQRQYGYCYTDSTGYYLLQSSTAVVAGVSLYIEIANGQAEPIYLDSQPRTPVTGQTVYSDIQLASQKPLGDPPPAVREGSFPPTDLKNPPGNVNPPTEGNKPPTAAG